MRWNRGSLVALALAVGWLTVGGRPASAEDPGDWAFRHRTAFMSHYFQASVDLQSGNRVSVLMFGDYQCETRLTIQEEEDEVRVEVLVARERTVQEQLAVLRARSLSGSTDKIFSQVVVDRLQATSTQTPILEELWQELLALRLPVVPSAGLMSPAVWYEVTASAMGEQTFEFPLPVPNSPGTSYIHSPTDSGYKELGEWVGKTLTALGGVAVTAATGGDCGIRRPQASSEDTNSLIP